MSISVIALSVGVSANAWGIWYLARWVSRIDQRVLDLEYPDLKDRM